MHDFLSPDPQGVKTGKGDPSHKAMRYPHHRHSGLENIHPGGFPRTYGTEVCKAGLADPVRDLDNPSPTGQASTGLVLFLCSDTQILSPGMDKKLEGPRRRRKGY